VKKKYDPSNFFRVNQNIKPAWRISVGKDHPQFAQNGEMGKAAGIGNGYLWTTFGARPVSWSQPFKNRVKSRAGGVNWDQSLALIFNRLRMSSRAGRVAKNAWRWAMSGFSCGFAYRVGTWGVAILQRTNTPPNIFTNRITPSSSHSSREKIGCGAT